MSLHCHDQIPNKKIRFECQGSLLVLHSVSAPHRNMNLFRYKKLVMVLLHRFDFNVRLLEIKNKVFNEMVFNPSLVFSKVQYLK